MAIVLADHMEGTLFEVLSRLYIDDSIVLPHATVHTYHQLSCVEMCIEKGDTYTCRPSSILLDHGFEVTSWQ